MVEDETEWERLLTVKEVAALLNVSPRTVWGLRAAGTFAPGTKIGKKVFWRESVLRRWLVEDATEEPGESATYKYRSAG